MPKSNYNFREPRELIDVHSSGDHLFKLLKTTSGQRVATMGHYSCGRYVEVSEQYDISEEEWKRIKENYPI